MHRRKFLTYVSMSVPAFALIACSKKEQMSEEEIKKLREGAQNYHNQVKFVSEGDPIAKTFKYVENPNVGMTSLRPDKEGVPGKEQLCSNCHFYIPKADKPYGECQIMMGRGMVKEGGWCISWAPKQKDPAA
ncbi:MAG: high-potential iron-sulfur protein [Bdellovibrionales bacterium]|nr:high-potential iron-sulfur protein [Bdellovibrionales bacterium]